jgi:hypothetical protein
MVFKRGLAVAKGNAYTPERGEYVRILLVWFSTAEAN